MCFTYVCFFFFCLQQLAALLITRQVVGNIKESLIPFLTETLKLANLGADHSVLTPSESDQKDVNSDLDSGSASSDSSPVHEDSSKKRKNHGNLTQAEVESAMYKVFIKMLFTDTYLSLNS